MAATYDHAANFAYHRGFGNEFESEALPGALPDGQNTPQKCPYGLYAEQLSGTAFTRPRAYNQRTWFYRIRPSVCHSGPYDPYPHPTAALSEYVPSPPTQMRWDPVPIPEGSDVDFVGGLNRICGAGDPAVKTGVVMYTYTANKPMTGGAFNNADGDMLFVPQEGELVMKTEMGFMHVPPGFICVIPRNICFAVLFAEGTEKIRGYCVEVFDGHFQLPDLGPIGANGLANPRDFEAPVAAYDKDSEDPTENSHVVVHKFLDQLYETMSTHSPFNVVAWHGNYYPYRYDLSKFCVINSVSFDHLDPCTFVVLSAMTGEAGTAACDFVIFPPRWAVQENTFRPPYFHRNVMSEFMGLVYGSYEAKEEGFRPGGVSLHSAGTAHGPDKEAFDKATAAELTPQRIADGTMAFMFESCYLTRLTKYALHDSGLVEETYGESAWGGIESHFDPNNK